MGTRDLDAEPDELERLRAELAHVRRELSVRDGELALCREEREQARHELTEALEQQTAAAEILRVIASSPADLQRVLSEVAQSAMRHSHSTGGGLCLREGDTVRTVALAG